MRAAAATSAYTNLIFPHYSGIPNRNQYQVGKVVTKLLLVALVPLLVAVPLAQNTETVIEFLGLIEAVNQNTITVNGQILDILGAQVNTPLAVGATVRVEAVIASDGRFVAREVNPTDLLPDEVEIIGTLRAFDGATITVSGQVIDILGAQINALIPIGSRVRVRASLSPQGTWVAREVDAFVSDDDLPAQTPEAVPPLPTLAPVQTLEVAPDDDGEFEIVGTLQQIGSDFIVVAGLSINVAGAEIKDPLVQGQLVKVHLRFVDGQLIAREVERADFDDDERFDNDDDDNGDNSGPGGNDSDDDNDSGGSDNQGMGMGD